MGEQPRHRRRCYRVGRGATKTALFDPQAALSGSLTAGAYSVAAEYSGDAGHLGSTSSPPSPTRQWWGRRPPTEIEGNTISGGLFCSGNPPAPTNDGDANRVTSGPRTGQCSASTF